MSLKRTCTFQTVLFAIARARGMRPRDEGIPLDVAETLAEAITEAYDVAFKFRDWPEALELEPLTVEQDAACDLPYLPRQLADGTVLHTVHGIWSKHPADLDARELRYQLEPLGYYLRTADAADGQDVWVKYRPDTPKFSAEEFSLTESCAAGAVRYDPDSGHCYLALQATQGYPVTDADRWQAQPLLDVLRQAVIAGGTAHYLRSEEQDQTAEGYEEKMYRRLEDEALRLMEAEQQHTQYHKSRS